MGLPEASLEGREAELDIRNEIIIPQDVLDLLASGHNATVGHHGVEETMKILKRDDKDQLPYMRAYVRQY